MIVTFAITRRSFHMPLLPLSERRARCIAAPVLLGAACLGAAHLGNDLLARLGMASVLLAAYMIATWWLVLTHRERRGVARLLRDMLNLPERGSPLHAR
jgi:hypothetical protein